MTQRYHEIIGDAVSESPVRRFNRDELKGMIGRNADQVRVELDRLFTANMIPVFEVKANSEGLVESINIQEPTGETTTVA